MKTNRIDLPLAAILGGLILAQGTAPMARADEAGLPATGLAVLARHTNALETTLRRYVMRAAADEEIRTLLLKHHLMLEYIVNDAGLRFCLGYDGKGVTGALGAPAHAPEVAFTSNAASLERFLSGFEGELEIQMTLNLNILRKLSLKKDWPPIRAALTRIYRCSLEGEAAAESMLIGKR